MSETDREKNAETLKTFLGIARRMTDLATKEERAQLLETINRQLETTQNNLETTKTQSKSLEQKLKTLDYNINQLELNIQGDEITSQKLGLEVDALNYDIRDLELSMDSKRDIIGKTLQEIQRADDTNFLTIFLKNESLADGVLETQSLANLRSQLLLDIQNLKTLHEQFDNKVNSVKNKRGEINLHLKNLSARKSIVQDQKLEHKAVLAQTKNKQSEYQSQLEDLKKQQDAVADEISKLEDELRRTFDISVLPIRRPGVFDWPVQMKSSGGKGIITQHFGVISNLYRGKPHNGLDIGAPIGTPVFAAADGVVFSVDNNDRSQWSRYQYGKYILIKHQNNLATIYGHLSRQIVREGDSVKRGDLIGYVGSTGYATGPHLHFGAYWAPSVVLKTIPPAAGLVPIGVIVDPESYL
jgi:murein DD-endopeptidase MepM/ murein hydrolase activator NlpD